MYFSKSVIVICIKKSKSSDLDFLFMSAEYNLIQHTLDAKQINFSSRTKNKSAHLTNLLLFGNFILPYNRRFCLKKSLKLSLRILSAICLSMAWTSSAICFSQTVSPQKMLMNCSWKSSTNLNGRGWYYVRLHWRFILRQSWASGVHHPPNR